MTLYLLARAIGMPKRKAARLYWDAFILVDVVAVMGCMLKLGFIHG